MNLKKYLKKFLVLVSVSLFATQIWAQTTIKGTVFESDGKTPVIGCAVLVKGTTKGVATDATGAFSIKANEGQILEFSCIGYESKTVTVGKQAQINVTLDFAARQLEGLVVTALGLTRSEKSLGYAVSKVANEDLTKVVTGVKNCYCRKTGTD
jgi:hypothetical protein